MLQLKWSDYENYRVHKTLKKNRSSSKIITQQTSQIFNGFEI